MKDRGTSVLENFHALRQLEAVRLDFAVSHKSDAKSPGFFVLFFNFALLILFWFLICFFVQDLEREFLERTKK